jgi:hypothetical protein
VRALREQSRKSDRLMISCLEGGERKKEKKKERQVDVQLQWTTTQQQQDGIHQYFYNVSIFFLSFF